MPKGTWRKLYGWYNSRKHQLHVISIWRKILFFSQKHMNCPKIFHPRQKWAAVNYHTSVFLRSLFLCSWVLQTKMSNWVLQTKKPGALLQRRWSLEDFQLKLLFRGGVLTLPKIRKLILWPRNKFFLISSRQIAQ